MSTVPYKVYYTEEYCHYRRQKAFVMTYDLRQKAKFSLLEYDDSVELVRQLELSCYERAVELANKRFIEKAWTNSNFRSIYNNVCHELIHNLISSDVLFDNLLSGEISPKEFVEKPAHELRPELYQNIIETEAKRMNVRLTVKTNDLYQCPNCGKSMTQASNLYNRCFDEAVSIELTCQHCGHSWKEN